MSIYRQLSESIGAGASELIPAIFESMVNEDEAKLLMAASPPGTIEELVEKSGIDSAVVEKMIDPLFRKGLIFKSKKPEGAKYYRVRNILQMHDSTGVMDDPPPEMLKLWREYMSTEWSEFYKSVGAVLPKAAVRVVPVNLNMDSKSQILAYDDVQGIIENASNIAVTKCSCRAIDESCDKPLEVCIQTNRAADYAIERGTGRKLDKQEALDMLKMCEEEGLVHISENKQSVGHVICNCCDDCCMFWPKDRIGLGTFVAPSRFTAEVDAEACSGCETCMDRCYFDAINMDDNRAVINAENCMGCGLCPITCPDEAIIMKETRPQDFVPA